MKYALLFALLFSVSTLTADELVEPIVETMETTNQLGTVEEIEPQEECSHADCGQVEQLLPLNNTVRVSVIGQGVAPMNSTSPAQAYALAKRAAIADGYRMIAERVKGVRVEGQDLIKNMMVARTSVQTSVNAVIRDANVLETTFKDGLCEVEMEIVLSHSLFAR